MRVLDGSQVGAEVSGPHKNETQILSLSGSWSKDKVLEKNSCNEHIVR